jgi:hypothetical protein
VTESSAGSTVARHQDRVRGLCPVDLPTRTSRHDNERLGVSVPPGLGRMSDPQGILVPMNYTVNGAWEGWKGDTIVEMTDGSVWKQDEYLYEYLYAYRPEAAVVGDKMFVEGMNSAVRVRRLR